MDDTKEQKDTRSSIAINLTSGQIGASTTVNYQNATDETLKGMKLILEKAETNHKLGHKQGFLFECIEAAKFNADAARKGINVRADVLGNHSKVDIVLKKGNREVKRVQAKSYKDDGVKRQVNKLSKDPGYNGSTKLVNKENLKSAKEYAEKKAKEEGNPYASGYRDTARNLTDELRYKEVSSGGTTRNESVEAAQSPKKYVLKQEMKAVGQEMQLTAKNAAMSAALLSGVMNTIQNGIAVLKQDIELVEAAKQTLTDTAKASLKSGVSGGFGTLIRYGATRQGINILSESNVATAVASGIIDTGVTIYSYIKGEIPEEEVAEKLADVGVSTSMGIYYGYAAGAVFGTVGSIIGSAGAYLVASYIYQVCNCLIQQAKLAEEEAIRVEVLAEQAIQQIKAQRQEFEVFLEKGLKSKKQEFETLLSAIDTNLYSGNDEGTILALADLANIFGKNMRFITFEEFDAFMEKEEILVL